MDGNFKLIVSSLLFVITFASCKNNANNIDSNKVEIVKSNLPILLDSLEYFDWTKIPVKEKFKEFERQEFKVELIDSILYEKNIFATCNFKLNKCFKNNSKLIFQSFKLDESYVQSDDFYNIRLVKKSSDDVYTLTIIFSNLLVSENGKYACIVVTKKVGITMKKDIYYFEKKNDKWNYISRSNISIG